MISREYVKINYLTPNGRVPKRVMKNIEENKDLLSFFSSLYTDSLSLKESIIRYANNIDIRPVCKMCGNSVVFNNDTKFKTYCCKSCEQNDPDIKSKNAKSVSVSLKNAYNERGDEIKKKRSKTLGINNESGSPFAKKSIRDKISKTIFERYGVKNAFQLSNKKQSGRNRSIELWKERGYDIYYDGDYVVVKNCCQIHGDVKFTLTEFNNRFKPERVNISIPCVECNKPKSGDTSIELKIRDILDRYNIKYVYHDRNQIKPKELDFYLPEFNVGIECNGMFWHSNDKCSHKEKWELCKQNGIQLLYFWEIDIINNIDKIEDIILTITKNNFKIYARNCEVREISSSEARNFLEENHLMGNINASIRYGLFYNNSLVQVMTFGKLRRNLGQTNVDGNYELYRLCSKQKTSIIGGASKLLKHFCNNNYWNEIITYANCDISNGNVYEKLGFEFVKNCGIGFFYCDYRNFKMINRFSLRRSVVVNETNKDKSTSDILKDNNILTCYNSGVLKYRLVR